MSKTSLAVGCDFTFFSSSKITWRWLVKRILSSSTFTAYLRKYQYYLGIIPQKSYAIWEERSIKLHRISQIYLMPKDKEHKQVPESADWKKRGAGIKIAPACSPGVISAETD
jgi:hypothetical protein